MSPVRAKALFFGVSAAVLFGGTILLDTIGASFTADVAYVAVVWAALTYWAVLRMRRKRGD